MIANLLKTIHDLSISQTVRSSLIAFPLLECIHLYSMVFLITVVATFDLRLMGIKIGRHVQPLSKLSNLVLKLAAVCFGVNFLTGLLLFGSKAPNYYANTAFRIKILLIVIGVAYHLILFSRASKWGDTVANSLGLKFVGVASLGLWVGVIAASRWIAFVGEPF